MFTLTIETDNAAFTGDDPDDGEAEGYGAAAEEVARILRQLADLLDRTAPDSGAGRLHDLYGNNCGSWKLS